MRKLKNAKISVSKCVSRKIKKLENWKNKKFENWKM